MKRTIAKQTTGAGSPPVKPFPQGETTSAARSVLTPYRLDPEFQPRPEPAPPAGPGSELSPHEREIVRRLVIQSRVDPSIPVDALLRRLPRGLRLGPDQKHLLDSLATAQSRREQELNALFYLDYSTPPPDIEQFLDDEYYLGALLRRTVNNEGLWPAWRNWLIVNAGLSSFLHELVIT